MNHVSGEECVPEFRKEVHCRTHGRKSFPAGYYEEEDSIRYPCGQMEELKVQVTQIPDDTLKYIYRKIKKTNHSVVRDGGVKRFPNLLPRLFEELKSRGLEIPNTSLTHRVTMNKKQAMESDIPVIIKNGTAVGKYDFGTMPKEITWSVLVTEEESKTLNREFDNLRIQKVSSDTKK